MPGCPFPNSRRPTSSIPAVPAHWTFPSHPTSVREARHAVAEALPPTCFPELALDLGLLVSELVTNAIRYGTWPTDEDAIEMVLWAADGHYWLAVSDPGLTLPTLTSPSPDACNGRGLLLVDAVSTTWAVVPRRTCGKSVVAGIRVPGA
ncbi:ATP-binding protein [Embleya sp. NPDC056575]|uniref:ATP-binding protein n=1 Tax=unclassified Embleya TaxID=2699296 RepID=UPI0036B62E91